MLLLVTEGDVTLKNVATTLLEASFQMSDVAVQKARGWAVTQHHSHIMSPSVCLACSAAGHVHECRKVGQKPG